MNWVLRRHRWHVRPVLDALIADIKAQAPDHVALTGDLVNLSAPAEFKAAATWLQSFGPPDWISMVPGNHDAYVPISWERGLEPFAPYMKGSMTVAEPLVSTFNHSPFPYVRFKGNVAIVGLTTALPQSLRRASGKLGLVQLDRLAEILENLRLKGCYRCVLIHHPPLPGLAPDRKAMTDAAEFSRVLQRTGAELVLHGHNHRNSLNWLESATGKVPVVGVASASMQSGLKHDAASWNLFKISRQSGRWSTRMMRRTYDLPSGRFVNEGDYLLSP